MMNMRNGINLHQDKFNMRNYQIKLYVYVRGTNETHDVGLRVIVNEDFKLGIPFVVTFSAIQINV